MSYLLDRLKAIRDNAELAVVFLQHEEIEQKRIIYEPLNNGEHELPDGMTPDEYIDKLEEERLFSQGQADGSTKTGAAHETKKEDEPPMPPLKEGSISKRKDGRWMGRYYENGKCKTVYASISANNERAIIGKVNDAIRMRDAREKESTVNRKMALAAWVSQWIEVYKKPKVRSGSLAIIETTFKKHILPSLGKKEVGKITAMDVEKMLNKIKAESPRKNAHLYLKACLDALFKNKGIKENPCVYVNAPKILKAKEKPSIEESAMVAMLGKLKASSPKWWRFAQFLAYSGLRKGEALALEWSDIDTNANTISVTKSYDERTKKTGETKTASSVRVVPLFDGAREAIASLKRNERPVFSDCRSMNMNRDMLRACVECGMRLTPHSFRHFFTSLCYTNGVDPLVIQAWVGHSDIKTTTGTYTHITPTYTAEQARKMAKKAE